MKAILVISLTLFSTTIFASTFPSNTHYELCFTPQHNCTGMLIDRIKKAKQTIYMQAYSFTSYGIAHALVKAHNRGVKVKGVFDQSNFKKNYFSFAPYLKKHGIAIWEDKIRKGIAHNKVMIIDGQTVETGSFNFTKAAQKKNAENMLIIDDKTLAQAYLANWKSRQKQGKKI